MSRIICKAFTITLPSGKKVTAEIESSWVYDPNYGADADGNKGHPRTDIEDVMFEQPVEDDDGKPLNAVEQLQAGKMLEKAGYNDDWNELNEDYDCEF